MSDPAERRAYFDDYVDTIEVLPPSLVAYHVRATCAGCGYPTLEHDARCALCAGAGADDTRRRVVAAFEEMPRTPMVDHERLWAIVLAGMRDLRIT